LNRVPAGWDRDSRACDSSKSRRASPDGTLLSDSVSSVVPYSQLFFEDRVSLRSNVPLT
jgi:hypothetical protein